MGHKQIKEDDQKNQGSDEQGVELWPVFNKRRQPVAVLRRIFVFIHAVGRVQDFLEEIRSKGYIAKLERFLDCFSINPAKRMAKFNHR